MSPFAAMLKEVERDAVTWFRRLVLLRISAQNSRRKVIAWEYEKLLETVSRKRKVDVW